MTLKMEMLGWAGTALVIVAYVPQIHHLYVEKCAWGISISTWLIWLGAGVLLLGYCIFETTPCSHSSKSSTSLRLSQPSFSPAEEIGFARIT